MWFIDIPPSSRVTFDCSRSWDIVAISNSLSRIPRWVGRTPFYSVAQHSMYVMDILGEMGCVNSVKRAGLLHDASESITSDIPSPVKGLCGPDFDLLESRIQEGIEAELLGCCTDGETAEKIKEADKRALIAEGQKYFTTTDDWNIEVEEETQIPPPVPMEYMMYKDFGVIAHEFQIRFKNLSEG